MSRVLLLPVVLVFFIVEAPLTSGQEPVIQVVVNGDDAFVVADEAVAAVDAAADGEFVDFEVIEALPEDEAVEVVEAKAGGGLIGGLLQIFGGGFNQGRNKQKGPSKESLNRDIDKIESEAELKKLLVEFRRHPHVQAMSGQFETQLNTFRDNDLRLIHYVCNLTRSEFMAIQKKTQAALLRVQVKGYQGIIWASQGDRRGKSKVTDPQTLLENELIVIAKEQLNREQAESFAAEVQARREFRREALIHSMTAVLDRQLLFSADQRENINKAFRMKWTDQWLGCVQYLSGNSNGLRFFPSIPKQAIQNVLTDGQAELFKSMIWQPQNVRFQVLHGNMFGFGQKGAIIRLEKELRFAPEEEGGTE